MFGLSFLFSAALFALPLAGLPILLHLLFRRKSPIVPFSTLRFVKSSVQRTAARKKVQRWLLLACRALLLALLIWAVAQPARRLASAQFGSGKATIAAIVVDTSYSMQLQDEEVSLLARADQSVQELLRGELQNAQVALFRSLPASADQPESLQPAAKVLSQWTPLQPQSSPRPLADRIASAVDLLNRQQADEKCLIILTDGQEREFPHPASEFPDGRVILLDLHPERARSAGVTSIAIEPQQSIPGLASEAVVTVAGQKEDSRAVTLTLTTPEGKSLSQSAPQMATLDDTGRAQVRFPLKLPSDPSILLTATLGAEDALAWDNSRAQLLQIPPRRVTTLVTPSIATPATRFVKLALDPSEGKLTAWPIDLRASADLSGSENVAVLLATEWPSTAQARQLNDFSRAGGTVVLFLKPGLEEGWNALDADRKAALGEILPAPPLAQGIAPAAMRVAVASLDDPLLKDLTDERFQISSISVQRSVPFASTDSNNTTPLLNVLPISPGAASRPRGLLFRKIVGQGQVYTFGTLPESRYTNLATHPLFLPILVRMALRAPRGDETLNVELGQSLVLRDAEAAKLDAVEIQTPSAATYVIPSSEDAQGRRFVFSEAAEPGIYRWRNRNDGALLQRLNVQLPADESALHYRPAEAMVPPGENVVVARSIPDLQTKLASLGKPEPRWSGPIAVVLFLLCLEALMGSVSRLWKPLNLRALLPRWST